MLALYDPKRETELHCDASSVGYGAVLMQRQDDGKFHPVSYFTKSTTSAESNYHSFELETLAIVKALDRYRIYLEHMPFKIVTDCNSLTLTLNKKQINSRIARWALELERYNYSVQHRSGTQMGHADALSRCKLDSDIEETTNNIDVSDTIGLIASDDIDFQIQIAQSRDENIKTLSKKLEIESVEGYELIDGLVFKKNGNGDLLLCVPSEMEENVIRMVHENICHQGIDKCYDKIRKNYWFSNMRAKIAKFIMSCLKCIMYSPPSRSNDHNMFNIPKKPIPFDTVHVDHFGPLPSINSKRKHIFVIIDGFTKYVRLYSVNSTSTKEVCCALDKYFNYYSRPRRLISDRGSCFTSKEFSDYLLKHNVEHVKVAVASPQANGQVERVNRVIKAMISKITEPIQHADWSSKLSQVEYAINNSTHSTTKSSPCELLFGVNQRGKIIEELTEYLDEKVSNVNNRDLNDVRMKAHKSIEKSQEYNLNYFLKHSTPAKKYSIGEFVVIRHVDTSVGSNKKFIQKYRGPYIIHKILPNDRYVVKDIENCQITQIPYEGIVEAIKIRKWLLPVNIKTTITDQSHTI